MFEEESRILLHIAKQRVHCKRIVAQRCGTHVCDAVLCLIECDGRRCQQARLQLCQRVCLLLLCRDGVLGQKDQNTGKRQEDQGDNYVKQRVEICDAGLVNGLAPETKSDRVLKRVNRGQEDDRTDEVKVKVYHCRTACILAAADGRQERGDTGTDILTKNNRDRSRIGNSTGR